LRTKRNSVGADLVALVREGGAYCGQGWIVEAPSPSSAAYGYTQLSRGCISGHVLAHELGHIWAEPRPLVELASRPRSIIMAS
jgi:hypothetical protein